MGHTHEKIFSKRIKGFTLIEFIIVVAIIGVLAGITIIALNPARQFSRTNNTTRGANVTAILNAVGQNMTDNRGNFLCGAGIIPASATKIASTGGYDIAPCLVSTYLAQLPVDPIAENAHWVSTSDYDTGYTIVRSVTDNRVTVAAPEAELEEIISVTR